jgi:hypothetical protein
VPKIKKNPLNTKNLTNSPELVKRKIRIEGHASDTSRKISKAGF